MARIRSLHPGQPMDEDYMALSLRARLLTIHLRCEADDHGAFPWKPLTLKARIFPADNVSSSQVEKLLTELESHNQVMSYEVNGKRYGVIRNFGKWQRPQKPSYIHPITSDAIVYAGFNPQDQQDHSNADSGLVPDHSHTNPISVQDHSDIGPIPVQYQSDTGPIPVLERSDTGSGISFQRCLVGGRRKEEQDNQHPPIVPPRGG
ncbi:MAG: hypothetical protein FD149_1676 [Rhodospirillaceae bacterium]|nr:MAG: hypothetical protein FD149_1676 [Rhodospirillaceae bacterium]